MFTWQNNSCICYNRNWTQFRKTVLSVYNFKINNCETEESKKSDDNIQKCPSRTFYDLVPLSQPKTVMSLQLTRQHFALDLNTAILNVIFFSQIQRCKQSVAFYRRRTLNSNSRVQLYNTLHDIVLMNGKTRKAAYENSMTSCRSRHQQLLDKFVLEYYPL